MFSYLRHGGHAIAIDTVNNLELGEIHTASKCIRVRGWLYREELFVTCLFRSKTNLYFTYMIDLTDNVELIDVRDTELQQLRTPKRYLGTYFHFISFYLIVV